MKYASFYNLQNDGSLWPSSYTGLDAAAIPLNDVSANYFNIYLVYTWHFAPGSDVVLATKFLSTILLKIGTRIGRTRGLNFI